MLRESGHQDHIRPENTKVTVYFPVPLTTVAQSKGKKEKTQTMKTEESQPKEQGAFTKDKAQEMHQTSDYCIN